MKIKSVDFKNFASYGNVVQRLNFERDHSDLILIEGRNGVGKSTLSKVITYMLYGRLENANLKDLPNRINGGLWGKIILESKGNLIEIERGIAPSILKVKINGAEYDVSGKSNIQDFLESEMYEIPYHVFKNVVVLSVNDFKSFITMSPSDKKQIIDKIFGFSILNEMKDIVKTKRKDISETLRICEKELSSIDESIESINKKIEDYQLLLKERNKENEEKLKDSLLKLNESIEKVETAIEKIVDKEDDILDKKNAITGKKAKIKNEIDNVNKSLDLYKNNCCPLCHSPLTGDFHDNLKHEYEHKLYELENQYEKLVDASQKIKTKYIEIKEKHDDIISKQTTLRNQKRKYQNELDEIKKDDNINDDTFNNLNSLIDDFSEKKTKKQGEQSDILVDSNYYELLEGVLSDDGVKAMALKSILPYFNKCVAEMCVDLNIPYSIVFNEKFDCIISSMAQEISPKTLSTGEKKRIDFAVIISLLKMIKLRFPSLNILFLDEIFSSIDMDGINNIIKVLHDNIKEMGINGFVINHSPLPSECFDKRIEIYKESGFSKLNVEILN